MALEPRSPRLAVLIDADNTSAKIADRLFEEIAQLGEANLVAVRVENKTLDEVGTGGLLGPVMFYSAPGERTQAD